MRSSTRDGTQRDSGLSFKLNSSPDLRKRNETLNQESQQLHHSLKFIDLKKALKEKRELLKNSPRTDASYPLMSPSIQPDDVGSPLRKKKYSKFKSKNSLIPTGNRTSLGPLSTWEVPPSLQKSQARQHHTCVVFGNLLLLYGGCTNVLSEPTHTVLTYDMGIYHNFLYLFN